MMYIGHGNTPNFLVQSTDRVFSLCHVTVYVPKYPSSVPDLNTFRSWEGDISPSDSL